eukprot:9114183-Prorocentrum_lima.AAC.1
MKSSLVGSEMCIRDRDEYHAITGNVIVRCRDSFCHEQQPVRPIRDAGNLKLYTCLLYTSDAADDM